MWIENRKDGKFNLRERYKDLYTGKSRTASIVMEKDTPQAIKKGQQILSEKIKKKLAADSEQREVTFGELYNEWYAYYKVQNKRTSWVRVPSYLEKHVFHTITKDMLIRNIDSALIMKIIDKMYTFGEYSLNYTKQIRTILSSIFRFAIDRGYLNTSPVSKTKITPKREVERQNKKKLSEKYLEKPEYRALLKVLYSNNRRQFHAMIAEFLLQTGLRYGELQALQWKNFDGKSISVEGTLDYTFTKIANAVKTSTKNESSERIVDLPERAIEILNELKKDNAFKFSVKPDDYIFLSYSGHPQSIYAFNAIMKRAAEEVDLSKHVTSHIFRHTHVSILAELNTPLKAIMERVGHSDANTTLLIYNHVTKKTRSQIIDSLNNIF